MFLLIQNLLIFYLRSRSLHIKVKQQILDKRQKDYDFYYKEWNFQMDLLIFKKKLSSLIRVKLS